MTETWLPVRGYEGLYEVSSLGQVRSLDRVSSSGRRLSGKMLTLCNHNRGYLAVGLYIDNVGKMQLVHRLVLEAFVGPCPDGMEACHLDSDKTNNRVSNLRWDTHLENMRDLKVNPSSKLTADEVRIIRFLYEHDDFTQTQLSSCYPVSQAQINNVVNKCWQGVS